MKLQEALKLWHDRGNCAHYFPRLKKVSLNGWPRIPEEEAIQKIIEALKQDEINNAQLLKRSKK